mmetsp:Transcript_15810/g.28256  ORF Transcript_15810/g.28256 Transcript_15810/m.28256 type:complete len:131 (+) Transcript_15810:573-965(+)
MPAAAVFVGDSLEASIFCGDCCVSFNGEEIVFAAPEGCSTAEFVRSPSGMRPRAWEGATATAAASASGVASLTLLAPSTSGVESRTGLTASLLDVRLVGVGGHIPDRRCLFKWGRGGNKWLGGGEVVLRT